MAKLTAAKKNAEPNKEFGLPEKRKYPMPDKSHARNARLARLKYEAAGFYRIQLHRHGEAMAYLHQRGVRSPELIEHMRVGYAPGGSKTVQRFPECPHVSFLRDGLSILVILLLMGRLSGETEHGRT